MKLIGTAAVFLAMANFALAITVSTPEIDGNSAASAVAVLVGGFLVARSRRKK